MAVAGFDNITCYVRAEVHWTGLNIIEIAAFGVFVKLKLSRYLSQRDSFADMLETTYFLFIYFRSCMDSR